MSLHLEETRTFRKLKRLNHYLGDFASYEMSTDLNLNHLDTLLDFSRQCKKWT